MGNNGTEKKSMNIGKTMLEKMMGGDMPDVSQMMKGYTFKDGTLKPQVEYSLSDGELDIHDGIITLYTNKEYSPSDWIIQTTLSLKIIAPAMGFVYIPYAVIKPVSNFSILLPERGTDRITFYNKSNELNPDPRTNQIPKGTPIGYGFFIPLNPISTIDFIKHNAIT